MRHTNQRHEQIERDDTQGLQPSSQRWFSTRLLSEAWLSRQLYQRRPDSGVVCDDESWYTVCYALRLRGLGSWQGFRLRRTKSRQRYQWNEYSSNSLLLLWHVECYLSSDLWTREEDQMMMMMMMKMRSEKKKRLNWIDQRTACCSIACFFSRYSRSFFFFFSVLVRRWFGKRKWCMMRDEVTAEKKRRV